MQTTCRVVSIFVLWGVLAFGRAEAQTAAASPPTTNAASTNAPPAAPEPIALAEVVTKAVADSNTLQTIQAGLTSDTTAADVQKSLPALSEQVDRQQADSDKLLKTNPALPALRTEQAGWQMLADSLDPQKAALSARISKLDATILQLGAMGQKWKTTLAVASASAPPDIVQRINSVLGVINDTTKQASDLRGNILSTQNNVANLETRISTEMAVLAKSEESAVNLLFTRDSAPLWSLLNPPPATQKQANPNAWGAQVTELETYVAGKFSTVLVQLLIFIVVAIALFWARQTMRVAAKNEPAFANAAQVFEVPLAMAALLALLVSGYLYPLPPRLFQAGLGAAALIPAVIILRRLIESSLFPILYAMVLAYIVDQLRFVLSPQTISGRCVQLVELFAAAAFLLWVLRSNRLSSVNHDRLERVVRIYAGFGILVFAVAFLANALGYVHLSLLLGNAMLQSSYLAVILYAAVRIAEGLIMGAMKLRPLSLLGMVQHHRLELGRRAGVLLRWIASLFWAWEALELFSLRTALWQSTWAILDYEIPYGSLKLSLSDILLFVLTVWGTVLISRLIRFVLEEEVYPKLKLGAGVPYATSTLVHYVVLVLGVLFALAAVRVDLSQYSVLTAAFGVGLGFGLQNIMNNFVSGIILLFERPIKVGDVIQVDTAVGTVERIGIRASVIRITNGSEIIMPNGSLISNPVTNWTLSNTQRVIEIPVAVAAKSDPQRVMSVLIDTAKAQPQVLQDPAPQALFTNLTGTALNFTLRVWTNDHGAWRQTQSDLFVAITAALAHENIATA